MKGYVDRIAEWFDRLPVPYREGHNRRHSLRWLTAQSCSLGRIMDGDWGVTFISLLRIRARWLNNVSASHPCRGWKQLLYPFFQVWHISQNLSARPRQRLWWPTEDEDARFVDERNRKEVLCLCPGQLTGTPFFEWLYLFGNWLYEAVVFLNCCAEDCSIKLQVLLHCEILVKAEVAWHISDVAMRPGNRSPH